MSKSDRDYDRDRRDAERWRAVYEAFVVRTSDAEFLRFVGRLARAHFEDERSAVVRRADQARTGRQTDLRE